MVETILHPKSSHMAKININEARKCYPHGSEEVRMHISEELSNLPQTKMVTFKPSKI